MEYNHLNLVREDRKIIVKFNRPKSLNAFNSQLLEELDEVVTNAKYDEETAVIIFTGEGERAFCAGADLSELQNLDYLKAKKVLEKGQSVFRKIELLEKPTIAAINGYALGGGFEIALACTLRIASSNAKFAFPEVKLGMIPGYGGTQRLPRLIQKGKALELLITGRRFDANEAELLGVVNRVVDQEILISEALQLAEEIIENSPLAVSCVLQAVERGLDLSIDQALSLETMLDSIAVASDDQKEGVSAFLEKRKPNFWKTPRKES
jgi:enoyl-CoA hydratase